MLCLASRIYFSVCVCRRRKRSHSNGEHKNSYLPSDVEASYMMLFMSVKSFKYFIDLI